MSCPTTSDYTYCQSCSNIGTIFVCDQCQSGYYKDTGSQNCLPCAVQYCSECPTVNTCAVCQSGYILDKDIDGNDVCVLPCTISNCDICDGSICYKCADDSYWEGHTCQTCSSTFPHCNSCITTAYCLSCDQGFKLYNPNYTLVTFQPFSQYCVQVDTLQYYFELSNGKHNENLQIIFFIIIAAIIMLLVATVIQTVLISSDSQTKKVKLIRSKKYIDKYNSTSRNNLKQTDQLEMI